MTELENVYMILAINNKPGETEWHKTGRGYTPFTTTNLGRAKGELTRCQKRTYCIYKLVKINDGQNVNL